MESSRLHVGGVENWGRTMQSTQSVDESRRLLNSIGHKTCIGAIGHQWKQDADDVADHSVFWLYCWGKSGMNSESARQAAIRAFDAIFPVSFARFDAVVDQEEARKWRYAGFGARQGMAQVLARLAA
jgi:hypothetical protein